MLEALAAAPTVATVPSVVLKDNVKLYGKITDLGGGVSNNVWFEWGTDTNYDNTTALVSQISIGIFSDTISRTGLTVGTIYHFRACASNGADTSYGSDTTFVIGNVFEVGDGKPYATIQLGVNAASANNGDVVYVHAGEYTENVNIR